MSISHKTKLYRYDFALGASITFSPLSYFKTLYKYFSRNYIGVLKIFTPPGVSYDTALHMGAILYTEMAKYIIIIAYCKLLSNIYLF